tara:strand:- start:114 stop:446 length:333 start_codon:yes stop_codon:yes gene_type:complete
MQMAKTVEHLAYSVNQLLYYQPLVAVLAYSVAVVLAAVVALVTVAAVVALEAILHQDHAVVALAELEDILATVALVQMGNLQQQDQPAAVVAVVAQAQPVKLQDNQVAVA